MGLVKADWKKCQHRHYDMLYNQIIREKERKKKA